MLIENKQELKNVLNGKIILLTGAGGGIGFEAAKAFAYMGAKIIIAEISKEKGEFAENAINAMYDLPPVKFYDIDLTDEKQMNSMVDYIIKTYGCPDVIFNNATITKMGAIDDVDSSFWDKSYAVNLKAPLLLTQKFLSLMKQRDSGTIIFVSSSGASPYMGAYEVFKTAQVELCNTLAMELENRNIFTFTIGPGLVKTETAMRSIEIVAESMGMSTSDFYAMNSQHILDVESAGVGFALSVLNAKIYHGQEVGSIQVLMDYKLLENDDILPKRQNINLDDSSIQIIQKHTAKILETFEEQYNGWRSMNVFERQWVLRDFKKVMSLSAEQALDKLKSINKNMQSGNLAVVSTEKAFFIKLTEYWKRQLKLLQGYEKNKDKLNENTQIINGWIMDINHVLIQTGVVENL